MPTLLTQKQQSYAFLLRVAGFIVAVATTALCIGVSIMSTKTRQERYQYCDCGGVVVPYFLFPFVGVSTALNGVEVARHTYARGEQYAFTRRPGWFIFLDFSLFAGLMITSWLSIYIFLFMFPEYVALAVLGTFLSLIHGPLFVLACTDVHRLRMARKSGQTNTRNMDSDIPLPSQGSKADAEEA